MEDISPPASLLLSRLEEVNYLSTIKKYIFFYKNIDRQSVLKI